MKYKKERSKSKKKEKRALSSMKMNRSPECNNDSMNGKWNRFSILITYSDIPNMFLKDYTCQKECN